MLLSTFVVETATDDPSEGLTLREAIEQANAQPGHDTIAFNIPASEAPNLDEPVPGFDPITQTWRIALESPLPEITEQVTIDGFSQAIFPVPFRYPDQISNTTQTVSLIGSPTGGSFTLTTSDPLPVGTTDPIPFNATAATVQARLSAIIGAGNVEVEGGPAPDGALTLTFTGAFDSENIPTLSATSNLTGGESPNVIVETTQEGGEPTGDPAEIVSSPSDVSAINGNTAQIRVILDGQGIDRGAHPDPVGLVLDSNHSSIRGLIIDGFDVGVLIPKQENFGNQIQGNSIGAHVLFLVDPLTGEPLEGAEGELIAGVGNARQGVVVQGRNTMIGGAGGPQENNVIAGNGEQGIWLQPGAEGNQIFGNQVGVIGPSIAGFFGSVPNGAEGILIESSSNAIGGDAFEDGNVISSNASHGIRIVGEAATRNVIDGNFIGTPPGGGFRFGVVEPGNQGDGIRIEDAPANAIGAGLRNVISGNVGAGVRVTGETARRNRLVNNFIGLQSDGVAALGNAEEGIALFSPENTIGPGNVIGKNLRGILVSGPEVTDIEIRDNFIGTDAAGTGDLGNALEGIRLEDGARGVRIIGDGAGSQVISGNNVGVAIVGPTTTDATLLGNLIGTDSSGLLPISNSQEGVLIDNSPSNRIGGFRQGERNVISANHWGVVITGASATANRLIGNFIGPSLAGSEPPGEGNELDGVLIRDGASDNLIGGDEARFGNTIAFNERTGARVEGDTTVRNGIRSNDIFANAELGIDLVPSGGSGGVTPGDPTGSTPGPNDLQPFPTLTSVASSTAGTIIQGTLVSRPNETFTIQFFQNDELDPSGFGQGQSFLGQAEVQTDQNGVSEFTAEVLEIVSAGRSITATATDANNNTSEFSEGVAEAIGAVAFAEPTFSVVEGDGPAVLVVQRSGGSGGFFSIGFLIDTRLGTAGFNTDYEAPEDATVTPILDQLGLTIGFEIRGTLIFNPGENEKPIEIPILDNMIPEVDKFVPIFLEMPVGAVEVGEQDVAELVIKDNDLPGVARFANTEFFVDEFTGDGVIEVVRDSAGGTVSVEFFTTDGGTATPGVDFVPTLQTLVFQPGQLRATATVTVLADALIEGDETVGLAIANPTGGLSLREPTQAILRILDDTRDRLGPVVANVQVVPAGGFVGSIVVTFNEALDPTRAVDPRNYGFSLRGARPNPRGGLQPGGALVGLASAVYNPAMFQVTLQPALRIPLRQPFQLAINLVTDNPTVPVGVSDVAGNLLDGNNDGRPGGPFVTFVDARNTTASTVAQNAARRAIPRQPQTRRFPAPTPRPPFAHRFPLNRPSLSLSRPTFERPERDAPAARPLSFAARLAQFRARLLSVGRFGLAADRGRAGRR